MGKFSAFLIDLLMWIVTLLFAIAVSAIAFQLIVTAGSLTIKVGAMLIWLCIIGALVCKSVVIVPKVHYAVYVSFGTRICAVGEGLHVRGWWHQIQLYPAEEIIKVIEDTVTTNDKIRVPVQVIVKYTPDQELLTDVFSSQSEEALETGLKSVVMKEIGIVAGQYSFETFYAQRGLIDQLLNCILRMNHPPHYDASVLAWVDPDYRDLGRLYAECSDDGNPANTWITKGNEVPLERRLQFYGRYTYQVRLLLEREVKFCRVRSRVEKSYGVDIKEANLSSVAFTESFEKAMQKEQEAKMLARAQTERARAVREEARRIKDENPNISEDNALWDAMAAQGLTQHYTFAGSGNVMPIIMPHAVNPTTVKEEIS